MTYSAPVPLRDDHELQAFDCGRESLNDWLKRRALQGGRRGNAKTYVVCREGEVVAYYCLAAGAIARQSAPGRLKRNAPDPVPVIVLGRLAVSLDHQGRRLGAGMMRDAVLRVWQAGEIIGIRAVIVNALDDGAARFYLKYGFKAFPEDELTLYLPFQAIAAELKAQS